MNYVHFLLALSLTLAGCAISQRTQPITNTFLEDRDVTAHDDTLPFLHTWIDPKIPRGYYSKVYFRSVTTSALPPDAWRASTSTIVSNREDFDKEARALADHFLNQLSAKVQGYPNGDFSLASAPVPHGLVFDIAITELEFSHPIVRAGALAAPLPGVDLALSTISHPHVAFAARVYDGKSAKLIATLADRKFPPTRLVDFNKLTVTSSPREIVSLWAEIFAEGLNRQRFAHVSDRGRFRLLPW